VTVGPEVGDLSFIPRSDVHQISVGPVGHLGPGSNELIAVVDQGPEISERLHPVGRRQDLATGHDPGDRHRVHQVRLPLGVAPAPLPGRQRGRYLPDVLADTQEEPRQSCTVAERALDPDHPVRTTFADPSQQGPVPPWVVGELPCIEHPAHEIHRRHGERALGRIDPDRHLHAGLLPSADYDGGWREDNQALG